MVLPQENIFEFEQLRRFMEELKAVLERVVLLVNLGLCLESFQKIEKFNPLITLWQLPRVANYDEENLKETALEFNWSPEQVKLGHNLLIECIYFKGSLWVVLSQRVVS